MSRYWFKPNATVTATPRAPGRGWWFTRHIILAIVGYAGCWLFGTGSPRGATNVWVWWEVIVMVRPTPLGGG